MRNMTRRIALGVAVLGLVAGQARAGQLISTMPANTPSVEFNPGPLFGTVYNEPLSIVNVGGSNVTIGSFGVYGRATTGGDLKWVILNASASVLYSSAAMQVAATTTSQWYDFTVPAFTLQANQKYYMGVLSDSLGFRWGMNTIGIPYGPSGDSANSVAAFGLTLGGSPK